MFKLKNIKQWKTTSMGVIVLGAGVYSLVTGVIDATGFVAIVVTAGGLFGISDNFFKRAKQEITEEEDESTDYGQNKGK